MGISSLKVLAANSYEKGEHRIVPLSNTRRENIYTGLYARNNKGQLIQKAPDTHVPAERWAEYLSEQAGTFELVGQDAPAFIEIFKETLGERVHLADPTQRLPSANALAQLAKNEEPTLIAFPF